MIVDFTIKNFRSIRDEQTLNMTAGKGRNHLPENFLETPDGKINLLKTAGVYGANASGKSNVLKAFVALQWIVIASGDLKEDDTLAPYEPYLLNNDHKYSPVEFQMEFIVGSGIRYEYQVSFNESMIITERLYAHSTRQKSLIFDRGPDDNWETIRFGGNYKGGTRRIPFFKNNSYLSKAGNSAASSEMMREIYRYFRNIMYVEPTNRYMFVNYFKQNNRLSQVSEIMSRVDTGIIRISSEENDASNQPNFPEGVPENIKKAILEENRFKFAFWHKNAEGQLVQFDEDLESDGTRRLFNILPLIIEAFRGGHVIVVDEIDASFHPHIVEMIINLFNDSSVNVKNAQLIFCTHDTNIMNPQHLRRDQLWFVEKREGATRLFSLDEYDKRQVKADSPFRNWYDEGRFGAVPRINYVDLVEVIKGAVNTPSQSEKE